MKKEMLIKTGRWLGVLPAAIASLFLAGIVSNLFFTFQGWFIGVGPDSGYGKIYYWIFSSAVSAAACVYFGSRVAPSHRKIVSMALAVFIVGLSTLTIVTLSIDSSDLIWKILSSLSSIVAAGYVVYSFFEKGDDFSFFD